MCFMFKITKKDPMTAIEKIRERQNRGNSSSNSNSPGPKTIVKGSSLDFIQFAYI